MIKHIFISFVSAVVLILLNHPAFTQITRGAEPGEIYIASDWYWTDVEYYAIFFSQDNGQTIQLMYSSTRPPEPGTMSIAVPLGDATSGVLYNYGWNELWVSYDYGVSWNYIENYGSSGRFTSGCINGEIYKCCVNTQGTIWRSIDYGNNFIPVRDSAKYVLEVGSEPGEVYGLDGLAGVQYFLHYSHDCGSTFTDIPIDTSVAFYSIEGNYPEIHRGTGPGEVYLVSWWLYSKYRIYHSTDTGQNFVLKYESNDINLSSWGVQYTAGREPGTFYVIRSTADPTGSHVLLYIDFSTDDGETFTTYFHDLGDFVGINDDINKHSRPEIAQNVPNPFKESTIIVFRISEAAWVSVKIYSLLGALVAVPYDHYTESGEHRITFTPQDLPEGIYYCSLEVNNERRDVKKMILLK